VKTFLLDLELRLNQVLCTNAGKIIEAFDSLHDHLEDNSSTILEKITNFSISTSNQFNNIPTKDFIVSTSEQYSIILSNKFLDLEEKIDHNFASLRNELIDKIKTLARQSR
jgi:hypothetical protein